MKEPERNKKKLLLFVTIIIPAFVLTILLFIIATLNTIGAGDTWWYLACGRYIVQHKVVLHTDIFSHTFYDKLWINSEWLTNAIFYLIFSKFGREGLAFYKIIMVGFIFTLIIMRTYLKTKKFYYLLLCLFLVSFVGRIFLDIRAQLSTFLFITLILLLIDFYRIDKKPWRLYIVPLLVILWVNLHGGYMYVFFIFGSFWLGEVFTLLWDKYYIQKNLESKKTKKLSKKEEPQKKEANKINPLFLYTILIVLCFIAGLINPYGIMAYEFPFKILHMPGFKTLEWIPPWDFYTKAFTSPLYWPYGILFILFSLINIKRLNLGEIFISYLTLIMSLNSRRFIPLFIFVSAPLFFECLSFTTGKILEKIPKLLWQFIMTIAIFLLFLHIITLKIFPGIVLAGGLFNYMTVDQSFPESACKFMKENQIKGRLFNYYNWGGYILWHLYPDVQIFIDGRAHGVYGEHFYNEYKVIGFPEGWYEINDRTLENLKDKISPEDLKVLKLMEGNIYFKDNFIGTLKYIRLKDNEIKITTQYAHMNWESIMDMYDVEVIIINRYANENLAQLILRSKNWFLIYQDNNSFIFLRRNEKNQIYIDKHIKGELYIPLEARKFYR